MLNVISLSPRKVAIVLEELGLTYDTKFLDFQAGEHKAEAHTKYNPNGRIPTLIDQRKSWRQAEELKLRELVLMG